VLRGLWRVAYVAFDGDLMRELAAEFLALAEKQGAAAPRVIAHHLMGVTLGSTGSIAEARARFDQALALYDPAEHGPLATRFGPDARVVALSFRAWTLWLLGFPEAARADIDHASKKRARSANRHSDDGAGHSQLHPYPLAGLRRGERVRR